MRARLAWLSWLLLAGLTGLMPLPAHAQVFATPDAVRRLPEARAPLYMAIMGQVPRPGVYELKSPNPELVELVRLAGGLSPDASGNIRLVRHGRGGQQTFFSPRVQYPLLNGDLFIVDRKHVQMGTSSRGPDQLPRSSSSVNALGRTNESSRPGTVQIGLVRLLDRPVIIEIPSDEASVPGVLAYLHQPPGGAAGVTVLRPGLGVRVVPLDPSGNAVLASGTVLVFDPKSVDVAALPRLPEPIRSESVVPAPLTGSPPAVAGKSMEEARLSGPTAGDRLIVPQVTPDGKPPQLIPPGSETVPDSSPRTLGQTGEDAARRQPAGEPFAAFANEVPAATPVLPLAVPQTARTSADQKPAPLKPGPLKPGSLITGSASTKSSRPGPEAAATPIAQIAMLAGGLFALVLLGLRVVNRRQSQPVVPRQQTLEELHGNFLDALIENRLPIVEEPLALPAELRIFGRPVAATDPEPRRGTSIRHDPAHDATHGSVAPHFPRKDRPLEREPVPAQIVPVPLAPRTAEAGLLDRALSAVQGVRR